MPPVRRVETDLSQLAAAGAAGAASTSLAFEFLNQPFSLNLDVSPSPPLVKARARTVFDVTSEQARSNTTIDLEWLRGRPFEVSLDVGPGLEISSIGPPDVVESHLTTPLAGSKWSAGDLGPRNLQIRLKSLARDQKNTTLRIAGKQRMPRSDLVELGVVHPRVSTMSRATYILRADRTISIEPDQVPGVSSGLRTPIPRWETPLATGPSHRLPTRVQRSSSRRRLASKHTCQFISLGTHALFRKKRRSSRR